MPQFCFRRRSKAQPPRLTSSSSLSVQSPADRSAAMPQHWRGSRSILWVSAASVLLAVAGIAHAEPVATEQHNVATAADPISTMVAEASQRFGIPASWIRAVMQVESFGDVRALSPKGAMGLMQIMPESWATLRSRYGLGADPYDAHDNILAGAAYLRELLDRYGSPGVLAAYNAGPARYEDHLATGRALPAETQAYVATLAPVIGGGTIDAATVVNAVVRSWTEAPLFVVSNESSQTKPPVSSNSHSGQSSTSSRAEDWTGLAPQSPGLLIGISHGNRQP
jgi:soluble lytic murein transglycosylase-like protein